VMTIASGLAQQPTNAEAEASALARRTLAESLQSPIDRIMVVRVSRAEWRDSSLGCPEPGMAYSPVLTSGYDVRLRDGDREHEVHVAAGRAIVCRSQPDARLASAGYLAASLKAAEAVRQALAKRLGVEASHVRIVSTLPAQSDARPCGARPAKPRGVAYLVEARVETRPFRYYTDDAVTVGCDEPARQQ
jgi:hypothetical protein